MLANRHDDRVRELTAGRGAEVVFDGAGGRLGRAAFEVTASGGRFSAHGMSDGGFAGIDAAEAHAALEARSRTRIAFIAVRPSA